MIPDQQKTISWRKKSKSRFQIGRFILICAVSLILSGISCPGFAAEEWYKGGSLHNASVHRWVNASAANRLATSADWFLSMTGKSNKALQKELKAMDEVDYQEAFKYYATRLERCVSEKVEKKTVRAEDKISDYAEKCYKILHGED